MCVPVCVPAYVCVCVPACVCVCVFVCVCVCSPPVAPAVELQAGQAGRNKQPAVCSTLPRQHCSPAGPLLELRPLLGLGLGLLQGLPHPELEGEGGRGARVRREGESTLEINVKRARQGYPRGLQSVS